VLGKNGWKYYNEVKIGDEILAFNKDTQAVQWESIKDIYVNKIEEEDIMAVMFGRPKGKKGKRVYYLLDSHGGHIKVWLRGKSVESAPEKDIVTLEIAKVCKRKTGSSITKTRMHMKLWEASAIAAGLSMAVATDGRE